MPRWTPPDDAPPEVLCCTASVRPVQTRAVKLGSHTSHTRTCVPARRPVPVRSAAVAAHPAPSPASSSSAGQPELHRHPPDPPARAAAPVRRHLHRVRLRPAGRVQQPHVPGGRAPGVRVSEVTRLNQLRPNQERAGLAGWAASKQFAPVNRVGGGQVGSSCITLRDVDVCRVHSAVPSARPASRAVMLLQTLLL